MITPTLIIARLDNKVLDPVRTDKSMHDADTIEEPLMRLSGHWQMSTCLGTKTPHCGYPESRYGIVAKHADLTQ